MFLTLTEIQLDYYVVGRLYSKVAENSWQLQLAVSRNCSMLKVQAQKL